MTRGFSAEDIVPPPYLLCWVRSIEAVAADMRCRLSSRSARPSLRRQTSSASAFALCRIPFLPLEMKISTIYSAQYHHVRRRITTIHLLITFEDVMAYLRISRSSLYRLAPKG